MPKVENPENYVQTWNSRSKKYVLIDKVRGGMAGRMSPEKFEDVPVVNDKPEPAEPEDKSNGRQSSTSSKPKPSEAEDEQPGEPKKESEKDSFWGDFFGS